VGRRKCAIPGGRRKIRHDLEMHSGKQGVLATDFLEKEFYIQQPSHKYRRSPGK